MQDAHNQYSADVFPIKHDMASVFRPAQAGPNIVARAAGSRYVREA
jgi:hypothetical protein